MFQDAIPQFLKHPILLHVSGRSMLLNLTRDQLFYRFTKMSQHFNDLLISASTLYFIRNHQISKYQSKKLLTKIGLRLIWIIIKKFLLNTLNK
jgi:uncharacterized membrane protein SirB2